MSWEGASVQGLVNSNLKTAAVNDPAVSPGAVGVSEVVWSTLLHL